MITKQEIKKLQEHQGYPCLSLFIQTHKTMPERLQDPIKVKDMIKEATEKLFSEFEKDQVLDLVQALDNLSAKIDYTKSLDGLALFVAHDFAQSYVLPFVVHPKIVIDKIFATKELIRGMISEIPYWVLSISQKPTRLFKGQGNHLLEVEDDPELVQNMQGFPFSLNYDVTSDREKNAYGVGDLDASYLTHQLDQFMHQLDDLLSTKLAHEHLPIVIMGTQKNRAAFEKITKFKKDIISQIEGDYTHLAPHDIEKIVNKEMIDYFAQEEAKTVAHLTEALGTEHCVMGIKDVWRQARNGKVRTLIIEENFQAPAYIDAKNPDEIILYDTSNVPGGYQDATDDIVNQVFHSKGHVHFVKEGALAKFEKIAAILWY